MSIHKNAGKLATPEQIANIPRLVCDYYNRIPDVTELSERVSFGTSGHRGSSTLRSFNDQHIAAICQALSEYRKSADIAGPMFIGKDTHALSEPALRTAIEVLVANKVQVVIQREDNESAGYTPTPVISRTIIRYNSEHNDKADGVVITPSHNPPEDGGFKYNPPHGGPAESDITNQIQNRANQILTKEMQSIQRLDFELAMNSDYVMQDDFMMPYIMELDKVIDMKAISAAKLSLATDPLGGAGLGYWSVISEYWDINIDVVNQERDPRFAFMHCDKDGKIRMDCSSSYAMAGLIKHQDSYDLAFGNDPDFDRHGIVCRDSGLMNPNHYLAVTVNYLYQYRSDWSDDLKVGKTLVSSAMIDRVAGQISREISEMPVGFKWFVGGLTNKHIGFAGEESAGGIFLQRDGETWATDKDGFIMCLLGAEMLAVTGKDPATLYQELENTHGQSYYQRVDVPATPEQKQVLSSLDSNAIQQQKLAGERVESVLTRASGNNAAIGGIKVITRNGWFAARPSGTENVYKLYAESFSSKNHLNELLAEAQNVVSRALS